MLKPIQLYDVSDLARIELEIINQNSRLVHQTRNLIRQLEWEWWDRGEEAKEQEDRISLLEDLLDNAEAKVEALEEELSEGESSKGDTSRSPDESKGSIGETWGVLEDASEGRER